MSTICLMDTHEYVIPAKPIATLIFWWRIKYLIFWTRPKPKSLATRYRFIASIDADDRFVVVIGHAFFYGYASALFSIFV